MVRDVVVSIRSFPDAECMMLCILSIVVALFPRPQQAIVIRLDFK